MKDRQEILADIQEGLSSGVITEDDLKSFVTPQSAPVIAASPEVAKDGKASKLSAVDVMFFIAGIVLYSAIVSMIVQSWDDGNIILHLLLSAGIGLGFWSIAYYLIKSPYQNDVRKGLVNSLLLTGSLAIITGGFIVTGELSWETPSLFFITGAVILLALGGMHFVFDKLIKRDFMLLMGVLLAVVAFPAFMFGLLEDTNAPVDVWALIFIVTAGILMYATRVVAKISPDRQNVHNSFDSFAAFIALLTMYIASFGDYDVLWLCALIAGVFGIFYLSTIFHNKHLLGNASFFLVLTVITIAFKYFSGLGVTASLIVATMGLLGSAAIASSINKKYFKKEA